MTTKEKWTVETPAERSCKGKQFLFKCDMRSWHRIFDADGSTVGFVPDVVTARQFAAEPDLLDAAESILRDIEDREKRTGIIQLVPVMDKLRAAIAKAKPA